MSDIKMINIPEIMDNAISAAGIFTQLDQEHTDRIVKAVYEAAFANRVKLAKMAQEETGIGNWEDKTIKNVLATQFVYNDIKDLKTVGIISEDEVTGITEIAQPIGPILGIIPETNPTSTTLFKILIALKTRNSIIIKANMKAADSCTEAARICYEAALKEDAPEYCIQWIDHSTRYETHDLMSHKNLALIIATGGSGLVKAAYSSGTPAIGVSAGNVPVFIEKTADIKFAVEQIMISKTFDNGTLDASEQSLIVEKENASQVLDELKKQKAYILNEKETEKVSAIAFDKEKGSMNTEIIGQTAEKIADIANIKVPAGTRLLVTPLAGVGKDYPLSAEILAPILSFYTTENFDDAANLCLDLNFYGGIGHTVRIGHTVSLFSNDEAKIKEFAFLMNAGRIVVNTPSAQGAIGGLYNTLDPSFTLSCGSGGNNITTDNITAKHLLNIQRIAKRHETQELKNFNKNLYLKE